MCGVYRIRIHQGSEKLGSWKENEVSGFVNVKDCPASARKIEKLLWKYDKTRFFVFFPLSKNHFVLGWAFFTGQKQRLEWTFLFYPRIWSSIRTYLQLGQWWNGKFLKEGILGQRSKGVRQRPINLCTSLMMTHKITPSVD